MICLLCIGVIYSVENDVCGFILSLYPHRVKMKNFPDHGVNRIMITVEIALILKELDSVRNIEYSNRPDHVAQLTEHWACISKVVGSIFTVARRIF